MSPLNGLSRRKFELTLPELAQVIVSGGLMGATYALTGRHDAHADAGLNAA